MTAAREDAFAGRSILGSMLRIALPLTFGAAVRYGVDVSNAYWIGKLGVAALSIVTALGTFLSLSKMFAGLTSAGSSAVLGRMVGEGRPATPRARRRRSPPSRSPRRARGARRVRPVGVRARRSRSGEVRAEAARYLGVLLAGLPLGFGVMAMNGALVGLGCRAPA